MTALPITVLIAAKNEQANIVKCVQSVTCGAERVVVLDSHSTDGTADLAREHGAEVVQFEYRGGYPKKRQWALDSVNLSTEWVLLLDADETVPPALWDEMAATVGRPDAPAAFLITKGFHFLGRRFRFGGFSFAAVLLFRRGKARFERLVDDPAGALDMEVHERVIVDGAVGRLATPLIHDDFKGLEAYLDRHNKYSTWEAKLRHRFLTTGEYGESAVPPRLFGNTQERRRWLKKLAVRAPFEPWLWFLYHYLFRLGFLEGRPGRIACRIRRNYISDVRDKVYELRTASRPRKGWVRKAAIVTTVALLLFTTFEVVLRVGFGLGNPPLLQADPDVGYLFQADQKLRRFGNRVEINAYHQRSAAIRPTAEPGTLRVLCLGDSVTWGGVQTDQDRTYPELLAAELRGRDPNRPVECLNASAGSWGLGNELAYLRRFGTFGSRYLVLQVGSHDLVQETSTGAGVGVMAEAPDRKPLSATGELVRRYARPKFDFALGPAYTPPPLRLTADEAFRQNLQSFREAVALGRAAGATVLAVHTPNRGEVVPGGGDVEHEYDTYRANWLAVCRELGVPVADLVEAWRRIPAEAASYYRDGIHPNPVGNAAIAGAVARLIP